MAVVPPTRLKPLVRAATAAPLYRSCMKSIMSPQQLERMWESLDEAVQVGRTRLIRSDKE